MEVHEQEHDDIDGIDEEECGGVVSEGDGTVEE
jgi:hypothetical protein